ncbi:MAG: hypothetical protein J6U04_06495 [Salinivirgaceae bacterium]|nr:hypothetical protein [Salinivirgaceae bacterium]
MITTKFRGKRLDNNEWVFGYFYKLSLPNGMASMMLVGDDIVSELDNSLSPKYNLAFTLWKDLFLVKEETVGQFVGLCDWKGREIYEGDVIEGDYNIRHVIRFKKTAASFAACLIPETKFSPNGAFDKKWIDEFGKEVIGNIHDNPDLLK